MRQISLTITAVSMVLLLPAAASAWNSTGHRVVALIAYKSVDEATRGLVCAVLKDHPAADSLWIDRDVNSPDDIQANMFLNAATFPDDARAPGGGFFNYHQPKNHYVNFKLTDDGVIGAAMGDGNLLQTFAQNLTLVKSAKEASDRALALSWVFHQVGDAHQPLHAVARFSAALPHGDAGGNLVKPFPDPRGKYHELHAYWDDLLGSDHDVDDFSELDSIATEIMDQNPAQKLALSIKRLDIELWTKGEGGPLAVDEVYGPLLSTINNGVGVSKLPVGYEANAQTVARRRIALAGYRLAEQLKMLVAAHN